MKNPKTEITEEMEVDEGDEEDILPFHYRNILLNSFPF